MRQQRDIRIAVVIPCYRVRSHILQVLSRIGPEVSDIFVVDDCCPEKSGEVVAKHCEDSRVRVIAHERNLGVGGATITGYREAVAAGAEIIVKIDGDGQMDPGMISRFAEPIAQGLADYTKGNCFFNVEDVQQMPTVRLLGNAGLSFLSKLSTGYWNIFDPTNGYTAVNAKVIRYLPLDKISARYFFESDLLFRLNILRCVVRDVPMRACYGGEYSNLHVRREIGRFLRGHLRNFCKRIGYNYFLRDFSLASVEMSIGLLSVTGGACFGAWKWLSLSSSGAYASSGTVMLAALPIIIGVQLLLSALNYDVQNIPKVAVSDFLDA